jgi:hypothetical protein
MYAKKAEHSPQPHVWFTIASDVQSSIGTLSVIYSDARYYLAREIFNDSLFQFPRCRRTDGMPVLLNNWSYLKPSCQRRQQWTPGSRVISSPIAIVELNLVLTIISNLHNRNFSTASSIVHFVNKALLQEQFFFYISNHEVCERCCSSP